MEQNTRPVVLNPLPDEVATVGDPFSMQIPSNTFQDLNGDELTLQSRNPVDSRFRIG